MGMQFSLKKIFLLLLLLQVSVCFGQPTADMAKLGEAYEVLSLASGNGGDVENLVYVFNEVVFHVNSGTFDPVEVENQLTDIIVQAEIINERALTETRNELITVASILFVVIVIEYYLWRVFPRHYWTQWLKHRGDWMVK
jgi:hypothetical protein